MTVPNLFLSNISNFNRFRNLALFVCHLFIDGGFRAGHIIYDPNVFDSEIISEIQSVCPQSEPWLKIDVTKLPFDAWKPNEHSDKVLQLIFSDPDQVHTMSDDFKDILVFYHLFVFLSIDDVKADHQIDPLEEINSPFGSNTLVVYFSPESVSVHTYWVVSTTVTGTDGASYGDGDSEVNENHVRAHIELIFEQNANTDSQWDNLFDRVFEKYEQNYVKTISAKSKMNQNKLTTINGVPLLGEFYFANRNFKPSSGKIYREISKEYQPIGPKSIESKDDETIEMQFDMVSPQNLRDIKTKPIPSHDYQSISLVIVFVYGTDLERQQNNIFISFYGKKSWQLCMLFNFLAVAILCYIRKRERLPRGGYISCYLDMLASFFGGRSIHITHRYERWLFGIVYIGNFFLMAIWSGIVLYPSFFERSQSIKLIGEIASIHPSIFMHPGLAKHDKDIIDILSLKIGPHHRFVGAKPFQELLNEHESCFAYVTGASTLDEIKSEAKNIRDLDLLEETLGSVSSPLFLTSEQFVPEQIINQILRRTHWMMAGGLHRFYDSLAIHVAKVRARQRELENEENQENDDDYDEIQFTFKQFMGLILFLVLWLGLASVVFLVETINFYRIKRRNNQNICRASN